MTNSFGCSKSATLLDNFFRPYPGFNNISMQDWGLTANYNSMQMKVTRRFHNGIEFGLAYTFGRAMDYIDSYNGGGPLYQNLRAWEYGPAGWDLKPMLVVNCLYSLPRGSRMFGTNSGWDNPLTRSVLSGWQLGGFFTSYSGMPEGLSLKVSNGENISGGGDGARFVMTCDPCHKTRGSWSFNERFNLHCA